MNTNMLAVASSLSDHDLLDRIAALAGREREASVELVAHLAALDARPSLHAARGYGSLFAYCTEALHLSEDAACNRIIAARACRRFPVLLESLAAGAMSLASVRLLHKHMTPENYEDVLARASGRSRREIEALVAELAPRPDAPTSIRKVPDVSTNPLLCALPVATAKSGEPPRPADAVAVQSELPTAPPPTRRPIVENTSPERYRVQFTIGKESHDRLRRLQSLLRREIPDGDAGAIVERALALLLEKVERAKLGATKNPRPSPPIRPGTDRSLSRSKAAREIPRHVKREVWRRDGGQCAFVGPDGHRCTERAFLEFHHVQPHALGGPATADNISLRCRRHNQYEADLVFGPRDRRREMVGSV